MAHLEQVPAEQPADGPMSSFVEPPQKSNAAHQPKHGMCHLAGMNATV
jgi:hypothetical protein